MNGVSHSTEIALLAAGLAFNTGSTRSPKDRSLAKVSRCVLDVSWQPVRGLATGAPAGSSSSGSREAAELASLADKGGSDAWPFVSAKFLKEQVDKKTPHVKILDASWRLTNPDPKSTTFV